jgi:hypothetical protein
MALMGLRSTTTMSYTYMAGYPSYAAVPANLPQTCISEKQHPCQGEIILQFGFHSYYKTNSNPGTADYTSVAWVNSSLTTTMITPTIPRYGYTKF